MLRRLLKRRAFVLWEPLCFLYLFLYFFQLNLHTKRIIVLNVIFFSSEPDSFETLNLSSDNVAVTVGTVGASLFVVIGVIVAFFAIRYA